MPLYVRISFRAYDPLTGAVLQPDADITCQITDAASVDRGTFTTATSPAIIWDATLDEYALTLDVETWPDDYATATWLANAAGLPIYSATTGGLQHVQTVEWNEDLSPADIRRYQPELKKGRVDWTDDEMQALIERAIVQLALWDVPALGTLTSAELAQYKMAVAEFVYSIYLRSVQGSLAQYGRAGVVTQEAADSAFFRCQQLAEALGGTPYILPAVAEDQQPLGTIQDAGDLADIRAQDIDEDGVVWPDG